MNELNHGGIIKNNQLTLFGSDYEADAELIQKPNKSKIKDWTGNSRTTYSLLGASNHSEHDRAEHDYYATDPLAARLLMQKETFAPTIWECACGEGHLAKEFIKAGYNVISTDLIDRGFGQGGVDFLKVNTTPEKPFDIVTNPPFKYAQQFVDHALNMVADGQKVAMFLRLLFLEGQRRKSFFQNNPPKTIYVSSSRIQCALNADFQNHGSGGTVCFAWFVWEKGYTGDTVLKWIN